MANVYDCLCTLGVTADTFANDTSVDEEFNSIKRLYFKLAITQHPDKGGDAEAFQQTHDAWECIRTLHASDGVPAAGFKHYLAPAGRSERGTKRKKSDGRVPSWEWFAEAAADDIPAYRVEPARSGRSQCTKCKKPLPKPKAKKAKKAGKKGAEVEEEPVAAAEVVPQRDPFIQEGTVRCGNFDKVAGSYSRWVHLCCWRVPSTVWLNLPASYGADPDAFKAAVLELESITLCGFAALDEGQQIEVLAHLADKSNWASPNKKALADAEAFLADRKSKGAAAAAAAQTAAGRPSLGGGGDAVALVEPHGPSDALVVAGGRGTVFKLPRPGVGGARAGALAGMTFVLTGVYPEVGGGSGLDLGKGRVESFIASFGGRVTSAINGKTNYLVVGASPGRVKVEKAQETGIKMVDIQYLAAFVEGPAGTNLRDAPPPVLDAFSKGYPSKKQIAANAAREAGLLQGGAPAKAAPKRKRKVKEEDDYEEDD